MATAVQDFKILFPDGYDARGEVETRHRGYLSDVVVALENGCVYKLFFTDAVRLQQTLEDDMRDGRDYYAEPGLVILPEVTRTTVCNAVSGLVREGFFDRFNPAGDCARDVGQHALVNDAFPISEAELLQRIHHGLSDEVRGRYHDLHAKRRAGTLTAAEHDELLGLVKVVETADVARLRSLMQLAKIRGTHVGELMKDLRIQTPPCE